MKKIVATLTLLVMGTFAVHAQNATKAVQKGPVMSLDKEVHDYGTIKQGANGTCEFKITNTGNAPLIVSHAKGSCGCTVPDWPKEPIMPGKSAIMSVHYDTKRIGPINKSVTMTSNAVNTPTKVVRITGKVIADQNATPSSPMKKASPGTPVSK